jgi:hypothetical protein
VKGSLELGELLQLPDIQPGKKILSRTGIEGGIHDFLQRRESQEQRHWLRVRNLRRNEG